MSEQTDTRSSFESECLTLRDDLIGFARKLAGGDVYKADDVVQDSLIKAFLAWERFDPRGRERALAVRAWLYRIVSYTYMKEYRYRKFRRDLNVDAHDEIVEATYGKMSNDLRDELDSPFGDEVQNAISELKPEFWETFQRFYVQGQTCDQIAKELGVPENTVSTRLRRARIAIGEKVADYALKAYGIKPSARRAREHADPVQAPERPQAQTGRIDRVMGRDDSRALDIGEPVADALATS